MARQTLPGKLLSPAGFGLVLLLFFLPFVAVSCGTGDDRLTATFSGIAMVSGGAPDITGPNINANDVTLINQLVSDEYDLEPLALFCAVLILLGMASALLSRARARHIAGVSLAGGALLLLVGAVLRAESRLEDLRASDIFGPDGIGIRGAASLRYGFWLAAAGLLVIAVSHVVVLIRAPGGATAPIHDEAASGAS